MAGIRFEDVRKQYPDGAEVVHGLNLEIENKEFVVFVGPSGCGKSTTLRMIAGLEDVTGGKLYIGEKEVNGLSPKQRDVAMVFQSYALYPHMTVRENMAFGLKLRKEPKQEIDRKVLEAAKLLGLEEYLGRKPKALSGGQRQRVALGRAMVRDPQVFLLDEPLSNLDAKLRSQMRVEIAALHKRLGTTFVYVTHDQTEAMTMGDRIVVMKDGYIQQFDTPANLYHRPRNLFVAEFIGTPQMNTFRAKLVEKEDGYYLQFLQYCLKVPAGRLDAEIAKRYAGRNVIAGIRPENVHEEALYFQEDRSNVLDATVEFSEMLGSEVLLYLDPGDGSRLIAKMPSRAKATIGEKLSVALDTNKLHLFDPETETAICSLWESGGTM